MYKAASFLRAAFFAELVLCNAGYTTARTTVELQCFLHNRQQSGY